MSTIIYKLRVIAPRSRDAPQRNKAHMEYIGRRRGVFLMSNGIIRVDIEKNEGLRHGLFGIVDGRKAEEVKNLQELSRYIEAKTKAGAIAYRAVISLAEADAMRLGYDDPEKWRELIRERLPDMCEKIGIPIQNLEYTAALHRDKGHPHLHLLFWDKAQDVKKEAFVKPEVSNAIRVGLIKHVFAEEMSELQALKNEARQATLDNASASLSGFGAILAGEFAAAFNEINLKEYAAAVERLKHGGDLADGSLIYSRFNTAAMRELAAALLRLAERVPKTGRLYMKLMPPDIKDEIRAFLEKVMENNADCDREFKKYV